MTSTTVCCDSFFFQAEDGIRDLYVTGVQTCALPISWSNWRGAAAPASGSNGPASADLHLANGGRDGPPDLDELWRDFNRKLSGLFGSKRSEERRVGKECRSRWVADHGKKKQLTDRCR